MSIEQLRFVERDGKKVLQQGFPTYHIDSHGAATYAETKWEDVPLIIDIGN